MKLSLDHWRKAFITVSALRRMVLGTGSGVGKSLTVAGICRAASRMGLRVKPFKSQNMSNNSAALPGGGEIARAQVMQARAARISPEAAMNPILLKPMGEAKCQVIFMGQPLGIYTINEYRELKRDLFPKVCSLFEALATDCDLVILEGAGSPAEINLLEEDIANTRMARAVGAKALLLGDIEQGGVFASLFGTLALLPEQERQVIRWLAINKFRGDPVLVEEGTRTMTAMTGLPFLGIMNHLGPLSLPDEDSFRPRASSREGEPAPFVRLGVLAWPHLSNKSDLDPLLNDRGVEVSFLSLSSPPPGPMDGIILPGTKRTMEDLRAFYDSPLFPWFSAHARTGKAVVGICGGYQMMGRSISDPESVESNRRWMPGLGLLPLTVQFRREKISRPVMAKLRRSPFPGEEAIKGGIVEGYEIRHGRQEIEGEGLFELYDHSGTFLGQEGATAENGALQFGSPIHGLFESTPFRRAFYKALRPDGIPDPYLMDPSVILEAEIDRIADEVESSLDLSSFLFPEKSEGSPGDPGHLHAP